jgi:hypothetical protein
MYWIIYLHISDVVADDLEFINRGWCNNILIIIIIISIIIIIL